MAAPTQLLDCNDIASEVVASLASHRQISTFTSRPGGLNLTDSYFVTPLLRSAFEKRGEKIIGRKIGFTNRKMWKVHGVEAPIWGYVTDHTAYELADTQALKVENFTEPRIEPEIMFGLKSAPMPDMNENALLDCIEWLSLGYEVVQSIFPNWKFEAPDTVVANGLHGALFVGSRQAISPRKSEWRQELESFEVEIVRNGEFSQRGGGALVLGSPLLALRHLVELLAKDNQNPPLREGEIISTGTLTLAMPIRLGESWFTKVSGIPLQGATIHFE
jgi:2-oxo-3-hexenedioate decarboxylase